jgi:hypothetical protein
MKKVSQRVELILADYPRARGDDNFLYTMYAYTYYTENVIFSNNRYYVCICSKMESFETIRRSRQKINEKGVLVNGKIEHYLPAESVQTRRKIRAKEFKKEFGHGQTLGEIAKMDHEYKQAVLGD